jgi:hypothetical protein
MNKASASDLPFDNFVTVCFLGMTDSLIINCLDKHFCDVMVIRSVLNVICISEDAKECRESGKKA